MLLSSPSPRGSEPGQAVLCSRTSSSRLGEYDIYSFSLFYDQGSSGLHTNNGTAIRSFTAHNVPKHGVVALLLQDAGDEPEGIYPPCAIMEWCMSENGTRIDQ